MEKPLTEEQIEHLRNQASKWGRPGKDAVGDHLHMLLGEVHRLRKIEANNTSTREGLGEQDMEDLTALTARSSQLLSDPHPGIAHWNIALSQSLTSISAILRRSGI